MITTAELSAVPLFSRLTAEQLDYLARSVEDITLLPDEYAAHEGDPRALFVVIEGQVELTKEVNGVERVIGPRLPGEIYGEVPMMLSMDLPASCRASVLSRVVRVDVDVFFTLAGMDPQVATTVGTLALGRMEGLKQLAAETAEPDVVLVGPDLDLRTHDLQTFLHRNHVTYTTTDPPDAEAVHGPAAAGLPRIELPDGRRLHRPSVRDVALAVGLPVVPQLDHYDLVVVGGGPTGLTAAVNAAAEGLHVLVVEQFAPGGQAGTSTRIENYTGFPHGVSGDELASRALRQAKRLGAEIVVTRAVESIDPDRRRVVLDGDRTLEARVVLLASGVAWRHLSLDDVDRFVGSGVYYGAARSDTARAYGQDVHIVGAGNSAGQAAVYFSRIARSVRLLVRGESLAASMSQYLIDQIAANPHITVETRSEVVGLHGETSLEAVDVADRRAGTTSTRRTGVLFVMIGADAQTAWLPDSVARDAHGYVLTGPDAHAASGWSATRPAFALETSAPGVFAAGDVRAGSVKRVAAGVGEGGMAVAFVHQFLALAR